SPRVRSALARSAGLDEAVLVGEDDDLDPVAQAQLGEDARDMGLRGCLADHEFVRKLGVRSSTRDQLQHLELAWRELAKLGRDRQRRTLDESLDQPAGDRWRNQRVAAGDRAHGLDELVTPGVLEQESARPCAQCREHVLVEVERREDQDRDRVRDVGACEFAGGLESVRHGHPYVHQHDVGSSSTSEQQRSRSPPAPSPRSAGGIARDDSMGCRRARRRGPRSADRPCPPGLAGAAGCCDGQAGDLATKLYKDEIAWQALVPQTARAWRAMPRAERRDGAVLAENYGEAGALALYGAALGLSAPPGGHLSFQYWHPQHMPQRHLLVVGYSANSLSGICRDVRVVARIDNRWRIANEEQGRPIVICALRRPLGQLWSTRIASDRL